MAKPASVPTWASAETNNTEPSSGQKASGWTTNQKGVSSYDNWYKNEVSKWLAYLDAGEWDDDLTVTGNLTVEGNTTLGDADTDTITVTGTATFAEPTTFQDEVIATDYNHATEFVATLPAMITPACVNVGMTAQDPRTITASGTTWWYYSPSLSLIGIRAGDVITKVRLRFSGNAGAAQVNCDVGHYRYDTSYAYTTGTPSTSTAGHIEVVPEAGKNMIETHDTMLDMMFVRVSCADSGVVIEGIDISWTHPA